MDHHDRAHRCANLSFYPTSEGQSRKSGDASGNSEKTLRKGRDHERGLRSDEKRPGDVKANARLMPEDPIDIGIDRLYIKGAAEGISAAPLFVSVPLSATEHSA